MYKDCTSALKSLKILTLYDFIDGLVKDNQNQKWKSGKKSMKILRKFRKLSNLFNDLEYMTSFLPFEINRRLLAQLVEKCQEVKHSYCKVLQKVKKPKKDMVRNHLYI